MSRRVLVVEDESMVAMLIEDLIEDMGLQVAGSAASAAQALHMATTLAFDIALLDVNLGDGETSMETAAVLIERGIPFAFLTGYGPAGVPEAHRHRTILTKPVDPAALRRFLES